jgi:hypothetical protein
MRPAVRTPDPEFERITRLIVDRVQPLRIVLFGSRARAAMRRIARRPVAERDLRFELDRPWARGPAARRLARPDEVHSSGGGGARPAAGTIRFKDRLLFLANALEQHHVGLEEREDGV